MELTLITVYADNCTNCIAFKKAEWLEFEKVLKERSIAHKSVSAVDFLKGLPPDTRPSFLSKVKYFPCIILISSSLLRDADKYTDEEIVSKISIMNGHVVSTPMGQIIMYTTEQKYKMTRDDYIRFIEDHNKAGTVRVSKSTDIRTTPTKACAGVVPINRYRKR